MNLHITEKRRMNGVFSLEYKVKERNSPFHDISWDCNLLSSPFYRRLFHFYAIRTGVPIHGDMYTNHAPLRYVFSSISIPPKYDKGGRPKVPIWLHPLINHRKGGTQ